MSLQTQPKIKTKNIKNYSSILAIVNHRNWLDDSPPLTEEMELLGDIKGECIDNYTEKFMNIFQKTHTKTKQKGKKTKKQTTDI